jgi:hypothetical protein
MAKGKGVNPEQMIPPAPKAAQPTQQEFVAEYQKLCKRMGWQISGYPAFSPKNDLGGAVVVVQLAVVEYKEPEQPK